MRGNTHFITGVTLWLAATPAVDLVHRQTPAEVVLYAVALGGTAMVSDLDHQSSTIAYTFGWRTSRLWPTRLRWMSGGPTRILARLVGRIFAGPRNAKGTRPGHRWGTHSLPFAVGLGFLVQLGVVAGAGWTAAAAVLALGLGLATVGERWVPKKLGEGWVSSAAVFCIAWVAAVQIGSAYGVDWRFIGLVYGLGVIAHCLGDWCTPEGVPWFWPFSMRRFVLAEVTFTFRGKERTLNLASTGGKRETVIAVLLSITATLLAVWRLDLGPSAEYLIAALESFGRG
jgi:membrane-bound metal-dependent hydrolase YbcI (DUF457 family)